MLSCKTALAIRVDALGEDVGTDFIIEKRAKLESQLRALELGAVSIFFLYPWLVILYQKFQPAGKVFKKSDEFWKIFPHYL